MVIVEQRYGNVLVEIVDLDRATLTEAGILKEALSRGIEEGLKKVVVDISQCEFVDSTFLGVLVNALKRVAKEGGDMKLVGFKPGVRSMFELTRLFRVFDTYSNLDEAVKSFN